MNVPKGLLSLRSFKSQFVFKMSSLQVVNNHWYIDALYVASFVNSNYNELYKATKIEYNIKLKNCRAKCYQTKINDW